MDRPPAFERMESRLKGVLGIGSGTRELVRSFRELGETMYHLTTTLGPNKYVFLGIVF